MAFNRAMLSQNWAAAAALTDSGELNRIRAAFEPALRNEKTPGSFRRWILNISTPGDFPALTDVEFAAKLLAFRMKGSGKTAASLGYTGVESLGHTAMRGDTTWSVFRWIVPSDSMANRFSSSKAIRHTSAGWRIVQLADFSDILPFIK